MISYVKGRLAEIYENRIVVDVNGMGVEINVPLTVLEELPHVGEEVKIHTYFRVSEDAMNLYGFTSVRDREMFGQLIGVSGIGPKGALAVLSAMTPDELRMAIMTGDSRQIAKAQGIGAKTAQRIIIDLKDKVSAEELIGVSAGKTVSGSTGINQEAIEALVSLGYSPSEAARAVKAADVQDGADVEEVLKAALMNLAL